MCSKSRLLQAYAPAKAFNCPSLLCISRVKAGSLRKCLKVGWPLANHYLEHRLICHTHGTILYYQKEDVRLCTVHYACETTPVSWVYEFLCVCLKLDDLWLLTKTLFLCD